MRRLIGVLAVAALLTPTAAAHAASVVRVTIGRAASDAPLLERLGFDVTANVKPGYVDVVLYSRADARRLRAAGFVYRRLPRVRATAHAAAASALPSGRTTYRHYRDYVRDLQALADAYPGLAREFALPERTVLGQPILGVELASDIGRVGDGRPVYLVLGEHHAREWPSGEVAMEFALDLARGYGRDARITSLLDRERVVVVAVVNPDGFQVSREDERADGQSAATAHAGLLKRKNCAADAPSEADKPCRDRAGVDLNRNYGAGWGGGGASTSYVDDDYRGPGPWSEPETRAIHELSRSLPVTGLVSLHNYAGLVLRPPGVRELGATPDEARLRLLGGAMARAAGYTSERGYDLYDVTGATEDWNYQAEGAFGYTIELGGPTFQGPYARSVVDQYLGRAGTSAAGMGVREALLLAGEEAAQPADHAVVAGTAPAGDVLRLHKDFKTATSPLCPSAVTAPPGACPVTLQPLEIDDHLDTTLTVPADGRFAWNIDPSTRPFVHGAGHSEAWTLTCETPDGQVLERQELTVWRDQTATVALGCGSDAPSVAPVVSATPPDAASAAFEARLRSLTSPAPAGARLSVVATRRGRDGLRVVLRTLGTPLRDVAVVLRDRDLAVVAARRVGRLDGRAVVVLHLPSGLAAGRYRLAARGYAPNGAPVSAQALVAVKASRARR